MRQASKRIPDSAEKTVRDIRRATRRHHSAEEKIRIVLEGLRGENSIAELCRKEGINQNLYYRWSKEFLEAGKKRLAGDTAREATSDEVKQLKAEARQLKETLAEVLIENRLLKKRSRGWGGRFMRYSASEKFAIIELVEQSALSIRRTLAPIGIPRSTFYGWYSRYLEGGIEALFWFPAPSQWFKGEALTSRLSSNFAAISAWSSLQERECRCLIGAQVTYFTCRQRSNAGVLSVHRTQGCHHTGDRVPGQVQGHWNTNESLRDVFSNM